MVLENIYRKTLHVLRAGGQTLRKNRNSQAFSYIKHYIPLTQGLETMVLLFS